jgi:hypothetical protein
MKEAPVRILPGLRLFCPKHSRADRLASGTNRDRNQGSGQVLVLLLIAKIAMLFSLPVDNGSV